MPFNPTKVVYCRGAKSFDVYVGRGNKSFWGNPWTHRFGTKAQFIVKSRKLAVENFERWLRGYAFGEVLPDIRHQIINSLSSIQGKTIACWCDDDGPCHARVLAKLADEQAEANEKHRQTWKKLYAQSGCIKDAEERRNFLDNAVDCEGAKSITEFIDGSILDKILHSDAAKADPPTEAR